MRGIATSAVFVCALAASAGARQASTESYEKPVKLMILAAGGLLGQIEGFCEEPGGTFDWGRLENTSTKVNLDECAGPGRARWLGGLMGLKYRLAQETAPAGFERWVILAGNNQPQNGPTGFWTMLPSLNAKAVALAQEDFYRLVRGRGRNAQAVKSLVEHNPAVPLLASNVVVRKTKQNLNTVEGHGYELLVPDEDASLPWFGTLKLRYPDATPTMILEKMSAGTGSIVPGGVSLAAGDAGAPATLTFPHGLEPNAEYRLTAQVGGKNDVYLSFRTDAALTPVIRDGGRLSGFPVEANAAESVIVVNLVDPDTRSGAAAAAWKWKEGDAEYELLFLDPVKTLQALLARAAARQGPSIDKRRPPSVVLIASLKDASLLKVLEAFPEIRVVVLPPESSMLSRAARPDTDPKVRHSGDLGFLTVLDRPIPVATKVMLRPEWFGETFLRVSGTLAPSAASDEWTFELPDGPDDQPDVDVVPGARFRAAPTASGKVAYTATLLFTNEKIDLGTADPYLPCPPGATDDKCRAFLETWKDVAQLTAVTADAVRKHAGADLAIVSQDVVDDDYGRWMTRQLEENEDVRWLSRYVLDRLIFASRRIVRAHAQGSALAGVLQKAIEQDDEVCISGLGVGCPSSLDKQHPERLAINGRRVNPLLFYSIAMAEDLAETLKLAHDDERASVDLVDALHHHLLDGWYPGERDTGTLRQRLEHRRNRDYEGYWAFHALDVGVTRIEPKDPEGRTGVRGNLPVSFKGAKQARTVSLSVNTDLALWDARRVAVRIPGRLDYTRRKELDDISFEQDDFSVGGRFDVKFRWLGETRLFYGYFVDGQLSRHPAKVTASRELQKSDGFRIVESADFKTPYVVRPSKYRHQAVGLELTGLRQLGLPNGVQIGFKNLGARFAWGVEENAPHALVIGGEEQPREVFDQFLSKGVASVLGSYFDTHRETFSRETPFELATRPTDQYRPQFDVDGEVKWKWDEREYAAEIKTQLRLFEYRGVAISPFLPTQTLKVEVKLAVPLVRRLKLTPSYTWERATIEDEKDDVFTFSRLDVKVSMPLVVKWGRGWLAR